MRGSLWERGHGHERGLRLMKRHAVLLNADTILMESVVDITVG